MKNQKNNKNENRGNPLGLYLSIIFIGLTFVLLFIDRRYNNLSKEDYLTERYQQQSESLFDWYYSLDTVFQADTILETNKLTFYSFYKSKLLKVYETELEIFDFELSQDRESLKTYEEIDSKFNIFFKVQGDLYLKYGFEFSPGGGYFYLPKSVEITDQEYRNLQQKLSLLNDFEKFWRTGKGVKQNLLLQV